MLGFLSPLGNLVTERSESATRNVNMFIPAGHVRLLCNMQNFSDRTESATRNVNMFIPGGNVRPFVQYAKFSDRTESVTKNMYKKVGIYDYIIIVPLGNF